MAETKLELTGDTAVAQREVDKLTKHVARLREELRKTNEETKKSKPDGGFAAWGAGLEKLKDQMDPFKRGLQVIADRQEVVNKRKTDHIRLMDIYARGTASNTVAALGFASSLGGLASGFLSVGAAGSAAIGVYRNWSAEMDKIAAKQSEVQRGLVRNVSAMGLVSEAPRIEKFAGSGPGTPEQNIASFMGVHAAAPTMAFGRREAIATEVAKAFSSTPDAADLTARGGLAGMVAELMPGASADDVLDVATTLKNRAGGDITKFQNDKFQGAVRDLIAAGMSPEQAMGMGLAAADDTVSASTLGKVAGVAAASRSDLMPSKGERGTAEGRAKAQLAGMSPMERIAALQNDAGMREAILGQDGGLEFSRLSPTLAAENTGLIQSAMTGNADRAEREGVSGFQAGRESLLRNTTARDAAKNPYVENRRLRATLHDVLQNRQDAIGGANSLLFGQNGVVSNAVESSENAVASAMSPSQVAGQNVELRMVIQLLATRLQQNTAAIEKRNAAETNSRPRINIDGQTE